MFNIGKEIKATQQLEEVKKAEPCDECKKDKPIYKVQLCEQCYAELFK